MDSPSSDTVQTLLVQSQLSLFLFLYKSHLQQRGDNPEQKFSLQEFSLEVNLPEWYSSVNIEGKKIKSPEASALSVPVYPANFCFVPFPGAAGNQIQHHGETPNPFGHSLTQNPGLVT